MKAVCENLACVAWRFCWAERRSGVAAKFAREARENDQSPRGFSALARLYYLARPTKTAMLRRLVKILEEGLNGVVVFKVIG